MNKALTTPEAKNTKPAEIYVLEQSTPEIGTARTFTKQEIEDTLELTRTFESKGKKLPESIRSQINFILNSEEMKEYLRKEIQAKK